MSTDPKYYDAVEATWPPVSQVQFKSVTLREGRGGGSRVSCATTDRLPPEKTLTEAEDEMRRMGQKPLFMIRDGNKLLDRALGEKGYVLKDPVVIYRAPVQSLADVTIPRVMTFCIWSPLAIQKEIWAEGGIDARRLAIMERATGAKTSIMGRIDDQPAGTAFVAVHEGVAVVHALEIAAEHRRKGLAAWMMRQAAQWALRNGADELAVAVTEANEAANGLYTGLGMEVVGRYHYRILDQET